LVFNIDIRLLGSHFVEVLSDLIDEFREGEEEEERKLEILRLPRWGRSALATCRWPGLSRGNKTDWS
jgi:hypothetical protein